MKIETVKHYACDICKTRYDEEQLAMNCEESCRADEERIKNANEKEEKRNSLRLKATSPQHFAQLLSEWAEKEYGKPVMVKFSELSQTEMASNSHGCPVDGERNWDRIQGKPLGYPAITGVMTFSSIRAENLYSSSDLFENIQGIYMGSGGSGRNGFLAYDITLWLQDFPLFHQKAMDLLETGKKLDKINIENRERHEGILRLVNNAIDDDVEIRECMTKIQRRKYQIQADIECAHPELIKVPNIELSNKLHALAEELDLE